MTRPFLPSCLPAFLPSCLPAFLPSCLPAFALLPFCLSAFLPSFRRSHIYHRHATALRRRGSLIGHDSTRHHPHRHCASGHLCFGRPRKLGGLRIRRFTNRRRLVRPCVARRSPSH